MFSGFVRYILFWGLVALLNIMSVRVFIVIASSSFFSPFLFVSFHCIVLHFVNKPHNLFTVLVNMSVDFGCSEYTSMNILAHVLSCACVALVWGLRLGRKLLGYRACVCSLESKRTIPIVVLYPVTFPPAISGPGAPLLTNLWYCQVLTIGLF